MAAGCLTLTYSQHRGGSDRWIPGACWPTRLAYLENSKPVRDPERWKKEKEEVTTGEGKNRTWSGGRERRLSGQGGREEEKGGKGGGRLDGTSRTA